MGYFAIITPIRYDDLFLRELIMCHFIRIVLFFVLLSSHILATAQPSDREIFDTIFKAWTSSFNQRDLTGTCNLFAKSLVADYQGTPQKNYVSICQGFEKIFKETDTHYYYRYQLRDVYRSGDLAAVRITWYLSAIKNNKKLPDVQDEGIDIFKKQNGKWEIINYIGYPVLGSSYPKAPLY